MISIDGMRPDYVTQADSHGLRIPALRALMKAGAYATGVRGVLPTVTYPSHTTLLTGVSPSKHGIYANATFDPLHKNMGHLEEAFVDAGLIEIDPKTQAGPQPKVLS